MRFFAACAVLFWSAAACAAVPLKGKHVELACNGSDAAVLLERLGYEPIGLGDAAKAESEERKLILRLDALYAQVAQILDLSVPDGFVYVTVVADRAAVGTQAEAVLGERHDAASVYVHERQTIYVAAEDFTRGVLGHEFAHAVISAFFVVPPPEKMQEVLSGYAEYMLGQEEQNSGAR